MEEEKQFYEKYWSYEGMPTWEDFSKDPENIAIMKGGQEYSAYRARLALEPVKAEVKNAIVALFGRWFVK